MSAPVWTSELGKSFWRNVRLGNIQCEFDERAPSGLWKAYEKEDGTLLTGSYYPRPSTKPLDCDLTKSGFIRLRFRVKGAPAGEDKPVNLKVPWDYIGHGQNRDSMLGKIGQPWVLEILNLLHRLRIPESERQSANVLKCEDAAKQALLLIQGVEDDWDDPTNQVHIIVKLHRVMTPQETLDGWECGNKYDWAFLRTRMYTKNWKNFPLPLAFNLKTLYTHMESGIVTRRSVLVTEAKGNGLHVGAFLNNRFCNTRRFPVNETMQIIFKVFKYVLKLQLDTLESEGAVLGDLHEQNITVMGGETREGPEGRVPGAEKLTFAVVDCSGTLPVINRPAPPWARPLQPARAWQVLRRLPDDNPWEEDEPQARPVQPAGPLPDPWEQEWAPQPEPVQAAGPPPGRLLTPAEQFGMFLGHRQQARPAHPAQPPNVQEQPVQENRWGRNRVPEPAGPPPGRKAGPAAGHQEGRVPEPADLHQDVKQDGRLLDTKKAECRSLLDRRRQSSLAKESPRPCRCSHLPRKLRRQVLLLLNSARHFRSTPRRMWRCPKSFQRSRPTVSLRGTWSERAGKASFRHFRASAERPRPWPKRVRASTHTSSERAVQVRLILLLCHSWVTFYIFWVLKPNQE